ncbi:ATP-grasp domain-containing protein [Streptomyces sp.]|uniref:ATP-grasp domain-containing protein n=1 Tax=Streptomyces sp. TaxID=1931 RepID=UPI002F4211CB
MPEVLVVYGLGSAGPTDIAAAAAGVADLVFAVDTRDEHSARAADLLAEIGPVHDLAHQAAADVVAAVAGSVAGVATYSETMLPAAARLAAALGLPFHSPATAAVLTSKSAQRTRLNAAGVGSVRQRPLTDLAELAAAVAAVGPPVVVKPDAGQSSRDTYRCDSPSDVPALTADLAASAVPSDRWVVERLLVGRPAAPGREWLGECCSVETAVVDGELWHYMITDKLPRTPPFRETGDMVPSALPAADQDAVRDVAARAIAALGVRHGVVHTEIMLTPDGPVVIEANGRLAGDLGRLLRRAPGFDPARLVLEVALGSFGPGGPGRPPVVVPHPVFMWSVLPPTRRVAVKSVAGPSHFRGLDGVWAVDRPVRPGHVVDWRRGTREWIFTVWMEAPDLAAVPDRLDAVRRAAATCVEYDELTGGTR